MKKIFFGILAVAGLFASCQTKLQPEMTPGQEAVVTFQLETPVIATRAYSDGNTATVLQYAVYDEAGNQLTGLTKTDVEIHGKTTVELQLTTGNTYSMIFWAAAPDAPYTVDLANKTMTVDYSKAVCNDESRDAFYKYVEPFKVSGAVSKTVELRRPFAQLNIGTDDYAASETAGYLPTQSYVTVPVYTSFDLVAGDVTDAEPKEVTFAYSAFDRSEKFPVAGYEYLAMNYILVPADKTLIEVDFAYTDGTTEKTRTVGSVPVQRNHRTNIFGQLLTSDLAINVEIKPGYDDEYDYPSTPLEELLLAASVGGEVTLAEDVVLDEPLVINSDMIINLNGKTISGTSVHQVHTIVNNANLTITDGTVESVGNNGGSAVMNNGTLTISNAVINGAPFLADDLSTSGAAWFPSYTINNKGVAVISNSTITSAHGAVCSYAAGAVVTLNNTDIVMSGIPGFTSHGIYTYNDGKVYVNGGNIANNASDQASTGASVINGAVYVSAGFFTGRIEAYYAKPVLSGGTYTENPSNYVADGYSAIKGDSKWVVVPAEAASSTVVETADNLVAALEGKEDVILTDDVKINPAGMSNSYGTTGVNLYAGQTFDGNGHILDIAGAGGTWDSGVCAAGGVLKNLTVTGSFRGIFVKNNTEKVVLENVITTGTTYTISCDQGAHGGLAATDCSFYGWTSYAATIGDVTFTRCYFGEGSGYSYCRPYAPTVFENCEFEAGYTIDPRAAVVFENCTFGGVALTAANIADLVTDTAKVTVK